MGFRDARPAGSEAGKTSVRKVRGLGGINGDFYNAERHTLLGKWHWVVAMWGLEQRGRSIPGMCRNEGVENTVRHRMGSLGWSFAGPGAGLDDPCGFLHEIL